MSGRSVSVSAQQQVAGVTPCHTLVLPTCLKTRSGLQNSWTVTEDSPFISQGSLLRLRVGIAETHGFHPRASAERVPATPAPNRRSGREGKRAFSSSTTAVRRPGKPSGNAFQRITELCGTSRATKALCLETRVVSRQAPLLPWGHLQRAGRQQASRVRGRRVQPCDRLLHRGAAHEGSTLSYLCTEGSQLQPELTQM